MEFLKELIGSPILYLITLIIVLLLVRRGLFRVEAGPISLGRTRDNERRILSAQINYADLIIESIDSELEVKFPEWNKYHRKYVLERVFDEFIKRITLNHISNDEAFIKDVQITILAIVRKRCKDSYFWTDEFVNYSNDKVKDVIIHLFDLRKRLTK